MGQCGAKTKFGNLEKNQQGDRVKYGCFIEMKRNSKDCAVYKYGKNVLRFDYQRNIWRYGLQAYLRKCAWCGTECICGFTGKLCLKCSKAKAREASRAHAAVSAMVIAGLVKKLPCDGINCVDCGKQATHWEHRDYRKPQEIEPICKSCNTKRGHAMTAYAAKLLGIE